MKIKYPNCHTFQLNHYKRTDSAVVIIIVVVVIHDYNQWSGLLGDNSNLKG